MEIFPSGKTVPLETGLHTNNTLRYVNGNKLAQAPGNSLRVALPGFRAFIGSNCTASFNCKGKIRPLELLEQSEDLSKRTISY